MVSLFEFGINKNEDVKIGEDKIDMVERYTHPTPCLNCIRYRITGKDYLTDDNGNSEYMCCGQCKYQEQCHKENVPKKPMNLFDFSMQ